MILHEHKAEITGNVRRETLHGRNYLVAPISLIVPGVLNGSAGPLLYTNEDTEAGLDTWNGIPIVVNHPKDSSGKQVSARRPDILEKFGIGYIFNAEMNGKLSGEGWFDIEQTKAVDSRILNAIESGKSMEVSTGVYTDDEDKAGVTENGVEYKAIARNHRGDHLAVLPDAVGACSNKDGCGLNVNEDTLVTRIFDKVKSLFKTNKKDGEPDMAKLTDNERKALVDGLITNCDCWEETDRETLNEFDDEKLKKLDKGVTDFKNNAKVAEAAKKGFEDQQGNSHTYNAEKDEWEVEEKAKEEPKGNETLTNNESNLTDEQKQTLNWAKEEMARQKNELVDRIVDNVEDDKKENARKVYEKMTLEELKVIAPPVKQNNRGQRDFSGAGGADHVENTSSKLSDEKKKTILNAMASQDIDWEAERKTA